MKRVFFIILFALWTNTCHAFDLDCNRWKISASSQDSVAVFYDNQTIVLRKGLNPPQIKVWLCFANASERTYTMQYCFVNLNNMTSSIQSSVTNGYDGKTIDSNNFVYSNYTPIVPGSVMESTVKKIVEFYGM